jgi:hypothetical protein
VCWFVSLPIALEGAENRVKTLKRNGLEPAASDVTGGRPSVRYLAKESRPALDLVNPPVRNVSAGARVVVDAQMPRRLDGSMNIAYFVHQEQSERSRP